MIRCSECGALNRFKPRADAQQPVCGKCKKTLDVSGTPQPVNDDAAWRAIRSADVPVLVDVWAPWCGPCRAVAPILEAVSKAAAGQFISLKVNSDENPEFSQSLQVSGIPTFVMFRDGKEVARQSGAMPKAMFEQWLKQNGVSAQPQGTT